MSPLPMGGGVASPADLDLAEQAGEARLTGLERARAAATKWQAGLAAVLAVVTGLSFTSIGEQLRELRAGWSTAAAFTILAAFVVAIYALFSALYAAGGLPRMTRTHELPALSLTKQAVTAARNLQHAIWGTLVALTLFAVAIGMLWFAPRSDVSLWQVASGGTRICGAVEVKGDWLLVTERDQIVHPLLLSSVQSWSSVSNC